MAEKVVLAYSGGVDTSVAIKWLQEKHNLEVIAFSVDVEDAVGISHQVSQLTEIVEEEI